MIQTKEFGYIVGVLLGDGYLVNDKAIHLETKDLDFAQRYKDMFDKLGINCILKVTGMIGG